MNKYEYRWADIAFGSKKAIRDLNAVFIAAPRAMSSERIIQLIKQYIPVSNLLIGVAEEDYIAGFDGQVQFKTLQIEGEIRKLIEKLNMSNSPHKIIILHHKQSDIRYIYEKIIFQKVLLINGSWANSFHTRPEYYTLIAQEIPFEYISPFSSEDEAREYAEVFENIPPIKFRGQYNEQQIAQLAEKVSFQSFDNATQTGAILAKKTHSGKYKIIESAFNPIVPYQTSAWHFGAVREKNYSPPGDLNHYDTVHAEVMLILGAVKKKINLSGTTLFINLLPCPTCARMISKSDIDEIVYKLDHSDGYAVALLEKAGKVVRRIIDDDILLKGGV